MIEISENGFDYVINRIKEFADENSGLKVQNKQLLRELRAKDGEIEIERQKYRGVSEKLEYERKDAKRLLETIDELDKQIKELKEKIND